VADDLDPAAVARVAGALFGHRYVRDDGECSCGWALDDTPADADGPLAEDCQVVEHLARVALAAAHRNDAPAPTGPTLMRVITRLADESSEHQPQWRRLPGRREAGPQCSCGWVFSPHEPQDWTGHMQDVLLDAVIDERGVHVLAARAWLSERTPQTTASTACDHAESMHGRCVGCGMTWEQQAASRQPAPTVSAAQVGRAAARAREHWEEPDAEGPIDCRCGGHTGPESIEVHRLLVALGALGIAVRP